MTMTVPKSDQVPVLCASEAEAHDLSDLGLPAIVVSGLPAVTQDQQVANPAA